MNFHHFLNLTTLHENKLLKFLQYGICPGTQDLGLVDRKPHPLHNRDRHQFFAILTVSQCVNVVTYCHKKNKSQYVKDPHNYKSQKL